MSITPMKILMVHGDKKERGELAIMLARFEHGVAFADGMASSEFSPDSYDLIIVDEPLSEGFGLILLQQLSLKNRAKIILLTNRSEQESAFYQSSLGVYECLEKPVKPMDLAVVACDYFVSSHLNDGRLASLSC
jgi:DNA-binding response OmpR family regulator